MLGIPAGRRNIAKRRVECGGAVEYGVQHIHANLHPPTRWLITSQCFDVSINAFHSFIGNGGTEDKTIDGWMVTGVCNGKSTGNNTSFLHNVFFMPELMAPEVLYASVDALYC